MVTTDANGIAWFCATGAITTIDQSRDTADDDRWSGNVTGVGRGYELTMVAKSIGVASDGHFASKLFGGNHSGGDEASQRWYDLGVRSNGEVQLQWEGPHPSNHDFELPAAKQPITNIGVGLDGNWVGLKWLVYKKIPGGSPANGGVRCIMWVNTQVAADGKPNNAAWRLCLDFIDGIDAEVIDPQDYEAPDECDIEIRRSGTDEHEVLGGGEHCRRLSATDISTFESGGTTPPPPPPPPPTGTNIDPLGVKMIYPTKEDGQTWFQNDNPEFDGRLISDVETITRVGDYFVASNPPTERVVLRIATEYGDVGSQLPCDAQTSNWSQFASQGSILTSEDWKNVEITAVVFPQTLGALLTGDIGHDFAFEARSSPAFVTQATTGCCGVFRYGGTLLMDETGSNVGKVRFNKVLGSGTSNRTENFTQTVKTTFYRSWTGIKFCVYNTTGPNNEAWVTVELWLCPSDSNTDLTTNWTKVASFIDKGNNWGSTGESCGGTAGQVLTWGTPTVHMNYDNIEEVRWKKWSVREIDINGEFPGDPPDPPDDPCDDVVVPPPPPPPPPPPEGGGTAGGPITSTALDSNGIKFIYKSTGNFVNMNVGGDPAGAGQRFNANHTFQNYMVTGYYFTDPDQELIELKTDGPNHGDCDQLPECMWYEPAIELDTGTAHLGGEWPHPTNHNDLPCPSCISLGVNLQNKWVGYAVMAYDTPEGRTIEQWIDPGGLTGGTTPVNSWVRTLKETDTGQLFPSQYLPRTLPTTFDEGLEAEIRMHGESGDVAEMKYGRIYELDMTGTIPSLLVTLAAAPLTGTDPLYRFISWGDNDTTTDATVVLDRIFLETGVSQYLFAGDGPYASSGDNWVDMMSQYFSTTALKNVLMLAQGNHEHTESESQTTENDIEAWFPGLNNPVEGLEWLQQKKVGNAYVIVMNSQDPNIDETGGDQYNYVQNALNTAKSLRAAGQIDWIITMVHKSWFNLLGSNPAYVTARHTYAAMFNDAQVDFMFHGHNHSYAIWRPVVDIPGNDENTAAQSLFTMAADGVRYDMSKPHGAFYIINGNGGHEINSWGEDPADFPNVIYANDTVFGYTVLDIRGKQATITAKNAAGTVLFSVGATRGTDAGTTDPPPPPPPPDPDPCAPPPPPPPPESIYNDLTLVYNINSDSDGCLCNDPGFTPPPTGEEPCPTGQHRDTTTGLCVPDVIQPPPPTGGGGSGGENTAIYNINYSGPGPDDLKMASESGDDHFYLKVGAEITGTGSPLYNKNIKRIEWPLRKSGNPTGDATVVIRRGSDNSIAKTLGTIPVSDLTNDTEYKGVENTSTSYDTVVGDRILIEYEGGDDNDYVIVWAVDSVSGNATRLTKQDNTMDDDEYRTRDQEASFRAFA